VRPQEQRGAQPPVARRNNDFFHERSLVNQFLSESIYKKNRRVGYSRRFFRPRH
jgi:hypothetical protein